MDETDREMKMVLSGDSGCGKTAFFQKLKNMNNTLSENHPVTRDIDILDYKIDLKSFPNFQVQIWDTAGQETFRGLSPLYYRRARCVVIFFLYGDSKSFRNTLRWRDEALSFCDIKPTLFLIGNRKIEAEITDRNNTSTISKSSISRKSRTRETSEADEIILEKYLKTYYPRTAEEWGFDGFYELENGADEATKKGGNKKGEIQPKDVLGILTQILNRTLANTEEVNANMIDAQKLTRRDYNKGGDGFLATESCKC